MRQHIKNFRENHGDTARVVLFDLAALSAGAFLLWSARNANTAKQVINAVYGLGLVGLAHKAANYLSAPKVQPAANQAETGTDNKSSQPSEDPNVLVRPATP